MTLTHYNAPHPSSPPLTRYIAIAIVLAALYFGLGMLGLQAASQQGWATAVFPASGLALAALLLFGNRVWPGIWLGALVLNLWPAYASTQALSATSILMSCAMSAGATLEALVGAFLVRRFIGSASPGDSACGTSSNDPSSPFDRTQHVVQFVVIAMLSCILSATIGVFGLCLNGVTAWSESGQSWFTWWTGDILGMLIVTPFLITWSWPTRFRFQAPQWSEAILLGAMLIATAQSVFGGWSVLSTSSYPVSFLVTPFLMWAAFRFGPRGAATAAVVTSGITIWGTMRGLGPYAGPSAASASLNVSLLLLQSYMAFTSVMVLVVAAVASERQRAEVEVHNLVTALEQRVAERTAELEASNQQLSQEIIERRHAEEMLREREERFRRVFEEGPVGIAVIGLDGRTTEVNGRLCKMLGYTDQELRFQSIGDVTHPEDVDTDLQLTQQLFAGEISSYQIEKRYLTKAGKVVPGLLTGTLVRDEQGEPLYGIGIVEDITQRKEWETEIKAREIQLAEAQRIAHVGSWEWDITTNEVRWSDELYRIFGWQPQEFKATPVTSLQQVHPEDREHIVSVTSRSLQNPQPLNNHHRIIRKDGVERILHSQGLVVVGEGGELVRMVGTTQDVTELQRAQQELQQLNNRLEEHVTQRTQQYVEAKEEAERANMAKSEFLSRMSHELRTPLNAILGFGQILDRQELTPLQQESVDHILKGGQHLLGLINEVLDISRVEAGSAELHIESVGLEEVVNEACALVNSLAAQHGIYITLNLFAAKGASALADRQRLRQVLINLLSNAIKYNHPGGSVVVSAQSVEGGHLRIGLADSGKGLSAQEIQKLFTPFERLHAANSAVEGTGLGLVISQQLITAMGGKLSVESEVGQGSTFRIELPQSPTPLQALSLSSCSTSIASHQEARSYTVLSIEDNLSNMRLMEAILASRPEITLLGAIQGDRGLDMAREHQPDLILLDLHLPRLSGSEVLEQLQKAEETKNIPVIVVSADATAKQIERLHAAGAVAYLTKPLDVTDFLNTLDEVLQRKG